LEQLATDTARGGDAIDRGAPARGAAVAFSGVTKSYGAFHALKDFELEIRPGEFLTLLGPSGSGKTTSLMLLAGFAFPSRGHVLINGRDVSKVPSYRRDQGIVFQSYSLFPHMTIEQNLAFPLETRGMARGDIARKTADALTMVRLDGFHGRYPDQLSGGQQQRVALARALVADPPLLLMDEPLGALDKNLREEMQLEIKHIQESLKLTVLYVTHDQEEALTMSDRIVVMNEGRIQQTGTPVELYERPKTRFVAEFVGDVNIVPGRVETAGARTCFRSEDGAVAMACPPGWAPDGEAPSCAAVRPEKIAMDMAAGPQGQGQERGHEPEPGRVRVDGRIREAIYLGQMTRYVIDAGPAQFVAKRMSGPGERRFQLHDEVTLSWFADDFVPLR